MTDDRNLDGARKAARAILGAVRTGSGPTAYQYEAVMQATDSRFDIEAAKTTAALIERAKAGDRDARAALHSALAWLERERERLPDHLLEYLLGLLAADDAGPRKRGQPAHRHHLRDSMVALAVQAVMAYGFDRTKNPATEGPSACSIVREVLAELGVHMGEDNVDRLSRLPS